MWWTVKILPTAGPEYAAIWNALLHEKRTGLPHGGRVVQIDDNENAQTGEHPSPKRRKTTDAGHHRKRERECAADTSERASTKRRIVSESDEECPNTILAVRSGRASTMDAP